MLPYRTEQTDQKVDFDEFLAWWSSDTETKEKGSVGACTLWRGQRDFVMLGICISPSSFRIFRSLQKNVPVNGLSNLPSCIYIYITLRCMPNRGTRVVPGSVIQSSQSSPGDLGTTSRTGGVQVAEGTAGDIRCRDEGGHAHGKTTGAAGCSHG